MVLSASAKTTSTSLGSTEANIHASVERDGNSLAPVSTAQFAFMALIGVPVWLTVLVPLTLIYQVGNGIKNAISGPKTADASSAFVLDSGYQVDAKDIIPQKDRKYDVVMLGATGFTGQLSVRHLAKTYGCSGEKGVNWAVAGRSKDKLNKVLQSLADELKMPKLMDTPIIVVDTAVASTLPNLVRDTKAVVTTVGPFRKYGSGVVEFCAKFGTHYADITGEEDWSQVMMQQWQSTAQATGAKILHFCGCDSVPWDLTVFQMAQFLKTEKGEDLASVQCFDEIKTNPSGGTLETMKLALGTSELPSLKEGAPEPFRCSPQGKEHTSPVTANLPSWISKVDLPWSSQPAYGSFFVMSVVNSKVVAWSQALRQGAPLTYSECAANPDWKTAFTNFFGTIAFFTAILNPITGGLLYKYVLPAPGQGPSMKTMTQDSFASIYAQGTGTKQSKVEALMYFTGCVGYLETARMLVESGLALALSPRDQLPSTDNGGFFSPSYGVGTALLERLMQTGTQFTVRSLKEEERTGLNKIE
ncbi:unnamed protein product [Cylindrotheca closterium]|uniref:Saccharopine dehydrogenase NADP binding domain-containing protein n=1 Tax=Cylindrotheca closterium TaxID=2856 RepID=A0AAD2G2M3_9STRA|nr:unnamed protein product [Cylindrotheca closterium]